MKHPECRPITVSLVAEAEKRGIRITSWGIQTMDPSKAIAEGRDAFFEFIRKAYLLQPNPPKED